MDIFTLPPEAPPEAHAAAARIKAAFEKFQVYANSPQPDPETMKRMQRELEEMINAAPSWTIPPMPRSAWPDAT